MKKLYILILGIILSLMLLIFLVSRSSLGCDVIIDKLSKDIPMPTLYYADAPGKKISTYHLENNKLVSSSQKMAAFTEGFIPQNQYDFYMNLIKEYATPKGITLSTIPHDFYEDEDLVVISFSGRLNDIYIIEKSNLRVHQLTYNEAFDLAPMYVSYVQVVGDYLILLAGEANAYNALIYEVYLPTFEVVDATRLSTDITAISDQHYTITSTGKCAFINGNSLKIYDPFTDTYTLTSLSFKATNVIQTPHSLIVIGVQEEYMMYSLLDLEGNPLQSGQLTLPAPNSRIVKLLSYNQLLYSVSFDSSTSRYPNYVSIYDINSDEILYSLGIKSHEPLALLDATLE